MLEFGVGLAEEAAQVLAEYLLARFGGDADLVVDGVVALGPLFGPGDAVVVGAAVGAEDDVVLDVVADGEQLGQRLAAVDGRRAGRG